MLPTFLLCGLGFALAYPTTNIAAVMGVAPEEQGLAGGLITSSFQFGGAVVLAVVTAVAAAAHGSGHTPQATLHGYHNALFIPAGVVALGALAMLLRRPARGKPVALPVRDEQLEADDQ